MALSKRLDTQLCKLTTQVLTTYNGTTWALGEWRKTSGDSVLCGPGWLHGYFHPLLAVFLNPTHTNINNPRLWTVEVSGDFRDGLGLVFGTTRMRLVEEIPVPNVTALQHVAFAILCSVAQESDLRCHSHVPRRQEWCKWAERWLSGEDRTQKSAVEWTGRLATVAACQIGYCERAMVAETAARAVEGVVLSIEESRLACCRAFPDKTFQGQSAIDLLKISQRAMEIT